MQQLEQQSQQRCGALLMLTLLLEAVATDCAAK